MSPNPAKRLLLVEDNRGDARLLCEMLDEQGAHDTRLTHVESMEDAEAYLAAHAVDVVLLDLNLTDACGLEAVQRARAAAPHTPLVVLTGQEDAALAVQSLQMGAQDYLIKGQLETRGLLRALRYAVERKHLEEALFIEKERAQVTLDCIGDAVACTDVAGNVTFLNRVAERLTGWSCAEATGQPGADVLRILDGTTRHVVPNIADDALDPATAVHQSSNCVLVRRDGFEVQIEESAAPIHDRSGGLTGTVLVFRDVGASRALATQLDHCAKHDFLTGLPNRMLLMDRIHQAVALASRHRKSVAVLFLDLDGFKHVNDSLGHAVGDKLLQSVASRLNECVRGSDTVSRQGGDEFVVLLSEVEQAEDATSTAKRMLKAVAEPHVIDGHVLHVATSIGVSVYPDDGTDADALIRNADTAMYQAKESGRHRYQFFRPSMDVRASARQSVEQSLHHAMERREFALHYQPKIDILTGRISGVEALLRWTHPSRGVVAPAQFIQVAEACGLIVPIGNWVLRAACDQARQWADAGLSFGTMAVNVSAVEFRDKGFLQGVLSILVQSGLAPMRLELELTEGVLMQRADCTGRILQTLRASGVRVAVDNFGTGYSSLDYLRKFPVDTLKIDQSFVHQTQLAGDDATIVSTAINMARGLHLRVVGEGVETLQELELLRLHGCDEAQGYYFAHPVSGSDLTPTLEREVPVPVVKAWSPSSAPAPLDHSVRL
ncbi:MAG: EAL domain-containing protein [bacterium]